MTVDTKRNIAHRPNVTAENPFGLNDPTLIVPYGIVGGRMVESSDGSRFDVHDPATGAVIGSMPDMTAADAAAAVRVADETFKTWRNSNILERQKILLRLNDLFILHATDLARLIVWENGKSWADAYGEVLYSASFCAWFAGECVRQRGDVLASAIPGQRNLVIKQPIGVCALLVPWNFPAGMITRKAAPVIATGCTAVVKADPHTPFTNQAIMELMRRAGVPDGVVNSITTHKHLQEVGAELTTNRLVKKVSFTGSTRVGKILAAQAAGTLKKLSLELGGNAPLIVFEDADLPTAVAGTIASKFRGSGQTCVCANRIYVHESVYDEFAAQLAAKVKQFKVGPGFDEGVTHGPLINAAAADKWQGHVDSLVRAGGRVVAGGKREGNAVQPTVIVDVPADCVLNEEETFSPLAALIRFRDEAEVVELANRADVGLAGYFFSRDADRIFRVAEALEVGMVGANTGAISQAFIPFGGVKESGYGKEGGYEGTDEFLNKKLVAIGKNIGSPATVWG
ncbi:hypothetical protein CspeluHIS016_0111670 [Cutaneotrichosporon spelunceum]|uniref:succinate-semialdehyde dehydrogenase [NAD(P)(+)] n=1 Tax=Cutaneotrichosporon spelunceum TaxID=1672016 RepID=A0AAD3TPD0_9TREE|nr:hypothetical protein CspeluHIS016_0111670 [Cutaneotrichosporon spelunceum]